MIRIIADTTCGLPLEQLSNLGIDTLPQFITFGEVAYRDDTEIDTPTFIKKLRASSKLPGTAPPSPGFYNPLFKKYAQAGDTVVVLAPSSEVSGTFRNATVAADEFPNADIHIVDTRTVASGLGSLVLQAHKWTQAGMPVNTLKTEILNMASRERVYFLVDTLEYLHKGGRIGGASALIGSILQVKPILTLRDGKVQSFDKQRTLKRALASIKDLVIQICQSNPEPHLTVSHCEAEDTAIELAKEFKATLGLKDVPVYLIPPAIVVHAGPGVISVSCFEV